MGEYIVVKDGNGWGVEWEGALINLAPMSKTEAQTLADDCNAPDDGYYTDENPLWDNPYI